MTTTEPDLAGRARARPARPGSADATRAARNRRKWFEIIGLSGPAAVVFTLFVLVPIGFAGYYSLYKWSGYGWPDEFIGLDNYFGPYGAFKDPIFLAGLRNNAFILVGSLLIQGPLAIAIALLLNRRFPGRAAFRMLVFVPYVLAEVTVGIMWQLLLQPDGGVDAFLTRLGLEQFITGWLANLEVVRWTMLFILTWKYTGFALILFLAGLANIPDELTEAAAIDGASWWQIQRHITLPLLGPTIRVSIFLSIIGALQLFDMVWVMTGGGPVNASSTMAIAMFKAGFRSNQFGYGSALAVILFLFCLVVALLYQRFVLRRDTEGAITAYGG